MYLCYYTTVYSVHNQILILFLLVCHNDNVKGRRTNTYQHKTNSWLHAKPLFALESFHAYITYVCTSVSRRPLAELPGGRSLHKRRTHHRKTAVSYMDRQGDICGHSHPARHYQVKKQIRRASLLYCSTRCSSDRVCVCVSIISK